MPLPANDPCVVIGEVIQISDATRNEKYPKMRLRLAMLFNSGKDGQTSTYETEFSVDGYALDNMKKDGIKEGQIVTVSFYPSGFEWKEKFLSESKVKSVKIKDRGNAPQASGPRASDNLNYTKPRQDDIPF